MKPLNLLGIAGSIRHHSNSNAILAAVQTILPPGTLFDTLKIGDLPHYDVDLEKNLPTAVSQARRQVNAADAVILVVPEFNHGIPGVLKNSLDWLSRPYRASPMEGKPVFFITQSEGALGGVRAQYQLRETLTSMLCVLPPMAEIAITFAHKKITDQLFSDEPTLDFIRGSLERFLRVVEG